VLVHRVNGKSYLDMSHQTITMFTLNVIIVINLVWNELNNMISESALYSAYKYPIATNSIIIELSYL